MRLLSIREKWHERSFSMRGQKVATMTCDLPPLHVHTPLIRSSNLSTQCKRDVYLKLDNVQPGGSFKLRGIGRLIQVAKAQGYTRVVCSSGGNAGMAASFAGNALSMHVSIFVPKTTPIYMRERLRDEGAEVTVYGNVWAECDKAARRLVEESTTAVYISPFDDPDIWEGHATMIKEIAQDLPEGVVPCAVVLSVGGGGLFNGVARGLDLVKWTNVPIIAVETEGAASFNGMVKADELVTLPAITSIAKSLGASRVSQQSLNIVRSGRPVKSIVVSDKEAVLAASNFASDHRMLVEPACGAALAITYNQARYDEALADNSSNGPLIVIVCGGNMVTPAILREWLDTTDLI
eukprot:CFRG1762T1